VGNADLVQCKININFTYVIWLSNYNKVQRITDKYLSANRQISTMVLSRACKNKKHRIFKYP